MQARLGSAAASTAAAAAPRRSSSNGAHSVVLPAACTRRSTSRARRVAVAAAVRAKSRRQVCCSKTLVARDGAVDQVAALCDGVAAFSRARAADRASGVLAFDVMRDQWEVRGVTDCLIEGGQWWG